MERVTVDGVSLEYEVEGDGEPVLLIHGGLLADFFAPLMGRPELHGYRLIRYHRAGYAGSGPAGDGLDISAHARHGRALLRHLGINRAHVVGHSSSAAIAVQVALDDPTAVQTLALLEMALLTVPSGAFAGEALGRYATGDAHGAVDTWMRGVCGPKYRDVLNGVLPTAFDQAVIDAQTFFGGELPALRRWSFGPTEASRVGAPTLVVLGGRSHEVSANFAARHEHLLSWLESAEPFELPYATHLLQVENPGGAAGGLAAFLARHPIAAH
jgi:pimeloyl-ACP methyl ester carboxylesterase